MWTSYKYHMGHTYTKTLFVVWNSDLSGNLYFIWPLYEFLKNDSFLDIFLSVELEQFLDRW